MPSCQVPWYLGHLAPSPLASWLCQEPSPWPPWRHEIPEMRHVHHEPPFGDGSRRNQYTARIRVARDWLKDFCEFPNVIGAGEFSAEMITMPAQANFGVLLHRHCPSKSQPAFKNHQTTSCPNITTYVILWTTNSYRKMAMILTPRAPASFISAAG